MRELIIFRTQCLHYAGRYQESTLNLPRYITYRIRKEELMLPLLNYT